MSTSSPGAPIAGLSAKRRHLEAWLRICGHVAAVRSIADEPTGILTHHLVQDAATAAFLDRLLRLTLDHPAAGGSMPRWSSRRPPCPSATIRVSMTCHAYPNSAMISDYMRAIAGFVPATTILAISPVGPVAGGILGCFCGAICIFRIAHRTASRNDRSRQPKSGCPLRARSRSRSDGPISSGSSLLITLLGAIAATAGCSWSCAAAVDRSAWIAASKDLPNLPSAQRLQRPLPGWS